MTASFARGNLPGAHNLMIFDDSSAGVKSDRWANMARNAIKTIAKVKLARLGSFHDQMFFAVSSGFVSGEVQELHARMRHF